MTIEKIVRGLKMRIIIAEILRLLFKSNFLKRKYFGIYTRVIKPTNLFKGVVREIDYHGIKLSLHIEDWIQQNIYFLGEYEKPELETLKHFLSKDSVFIDVGANFGLYTLQASKLIGEKGRIICFEPFAENFNSLTTNIALNNLANVIAEKLAVGEKEDTITLYCDDQEQNLGMTSTKFRENALTEVVQIVSLDSFLQKEQFEHIDFIKIDIEGHEYAALLGMRETLTKYKPTLLIEIFTDTNSDNNEKINDFLESVGYKKWFIDDVGNLSETPVNSKRDNYIFTIRD